MALKTASMSDPGVAMKVSLVTDRTRMKPTYAVSVPSHQDMPVTAPSGRNMRTAKTQATPIVPGPKGKATIRFDGSNRWK